MEDFFIGIKLLAYNTKSVEAAVASTLFVLLLILCKGFPSISFT